MFRGSYYKVIKTVISFCFIFFIYFTAKAQITFFINETPVNSSQKSLLVFADTSADRSWQRYQSISHELTAYSQKKYSASFNNNMLWVKISIDSLRKTDSLNYFMIRNPHINYLKVWLLKGDSIVKNFSLTGDRLLFNTRAIHHPDFVFPLPDKTDKNYSLLLLIDKRNEILHIPLHLLNENGFLSYNRKKNLITGLITGISIFLFLFNLFLFVQMKERLYVFYGSYILMGLFYILSDYGYSFMYLFPDNPLPADYMRPISISLATPLYLLFCIHLLNIKTKLPVSYKWLTRGLICYFAIFLVSIPFMGNMGTIRAFLQNLMQVLLTLLVLGNLVVAINAWRKKIRYAVYIVITSIFLFVSISLFVFYLSGNIPDTLLTRNLMNIAFIGEISILAFALSLRFKDYKEQSEELIRKSSLQQEQIFKTVTDYQEKELQRLSSMLHDSVGARLSALRFNLESGKNENTQQDKIDLAIGEINNLANDVRRFSHSFSPVLLQQRGLREALQQFINPINESGRLYIQFEMMGTQERTSFRYELLIYNIIQELLQNIIKHAQATEGIVQLILEDGLVSVFVEDNGKGFNIDQINDGLGFSQIKQLVTFVSGTLRMSSFENNGTRISIEFSTLPDERKYPDTYS
jgi:signal transduction histidine kinase